MEKNVEKIVNILNKLYPYNYHEEDPFFVLIRTVLSQRTKDVNTDKAAEQLFSVCKTPKQISSASLKSLEKLIRPSGFYRQKAKRIKDISRIILEKYNGRVPDKIDELVKLPGVGRKTAGCVLVFAFDKPAIPVDTHVHRISNRLGMVKTKTPDKTEQELMKIIQKRHWKNINTAFVAHGQTACRPRTPRCYECKLKSYCGYYRYDRQA